MKKHAALAAALITSIAAAAQAAPVVVEANGIRLSVLVKGANLEVTVRAPTSGWVAVGFNPSNKMKDADFLIGYVKDGKAFARDDFGTGTGSHAEDAKIGGKDNLVSFSGVEKDGVTEVTFVVPRDSGDAKDSKLLAGEHSVILAYSRGDSFAAGHAAVAKAKIVLP